jgi:hypothetical protein
MNLAYSMAVMASLSYWPFHKRPLPENRTSLELLTFKNGTPERLLQRQHHRRHRRRRKRDQAIGLVLKGISTALNQASPWLPKTRRNRQNQGSYREGWKASLQRQMTKSEQFHQEDSMLQQQQQHPGTIQLEYFLYNWYEPTSL